MRVYAVATPDGYRVMPGGLARIAAEGVVDIVSSQRGGGSKDVWVLAGHGRAPSRRAARSSASRTALPRRMRHDELPSQLVENLYWLGRYSERCEDKARLVRATLAMRTNAVGLAPRARAVHSLRRAAAEGDPAQTRYSTTPTSSGWPPTWAASAGAPRSRAAGCRPSIGARSASCSSQFQHAGAPSAIRSRRLIGCWWR